MAGTMKNMKALLSDSRSRIILLFLGFVIIAVLVVAAISIRSRIAGPEGASSIVGGAGNIESVPFATNPTEQYAKLIEEQNVQKASTAQKTGGSAIPTIIQAKEFGEGESIGPTEGQGGVGFSTLRNSDLYGGIQKDLWLKTLKDGNCSLASVQSVVSQGATLQNVREVCSCAQLKSDGYTPEQLKPVCNCEDLRAAGFSALQMKNAGYSASQLHACGYDACQMRAAGFTAAELLAAGYTEGELKGAGFSLEEIRAGSGLPTGLTEEDIRKAGCSPDALARLRAAGVSASAIRRVSGCSLEQLKAGGYTAAELKAAGFTAAELKQAGFSDDELRAAGFTDKELSALEALKKAGCSVEALKKARAAGVTATQVRQTLGCSAEMMRLAGYTAKELKDAGFSAAELKAAGFSAKELKDAGFTAAELKAAGFSAKELRDAGFTAAQLKEAGFTAAELRAAGFSAEELKAAGFTAKELKDAGFSAEELRRAGFTAAELRAAGFTAAELRAAGFSAKDLANAGFSADEIRAAGYNDADLRLAGLSTAVDVTGAPSYTGQQPGVGTDSSRQLEQVLQAQAARISEQRLQQKIQTRTAQLGSQMSQVVNEWQPVEQFYTAAKEVDEKKEGGANGAVDATSTEALRAQQAHGPGYMSDKATIKAGEVMFAVMDTSVNSDEEGPVLATIVSGPLKGSRVIGTFTPPPAGGNQQKIVLTFNIINVPGAEKSTSINAVAIDPQTARTALASHVDNHYLLRYGSLFASSFMEGIGSAYQAQGTSITAGGVPGAAGGATGASQNTTTISQSDRTLTENAIAGLAKVGQRWGNQVAPLFNRPPTIQIYSGTSLGLLIQADFTYAKPQTNGL